MAFLLMNKDRPVRSFEIRGTGDLEYCADEKNLSGRQPFSGSIETFISNRSAIKHRKHVQDILDKCGGKTMSGFLSLTHGLSLNDTLWVKKDTEKNLLWRDVSLYRNDFNEVLSRLAFDGNGLYGEQFSVTSPELTTSGMFDKCWVRSSAGIHLLKAGSEGARNAGREPYGEALASQMYAPFAGGVSYGLQRYHGRMTSFCDLFTDETYGFKSAVELGLAGRSFGGVLSYYKEHGLEEPFRRMMLMDAVTLNSDRHLGNFGMFVHNDTFEPVPEHGLPVFDYNLSFAPYADYEDLEQGFQNMDKWMRTHPPVWGSSYETLAEAVSIPKLRKELAEYADLKLEIKPDQKFPQWRIDVVNEMKNTMIRRITGRGSRGFFIPSFQADPPSGLSLKEAVRKNREPQKSAPAGRIKDASFSSSEKLAMAYRDLEEREEGHQYDNDFETE